MNNVEEIKRALTDRLESVLDHYFPGHVKAKGKAYPEPKTAKDLGSFEVILTGTRRGSWFRNSQSIGGDPINLIAYAVTGNHKRNGEGLAGARRFLGWSKERPAGRRADDKRQAEAERLERLRIEENRKAAYRFWKNSIPIKGTPAETYLTYRGIDFAFDTRALRCHLTTTSACLVCAVTGPDGKFRGIWRILLRPDGLGKADVEKPKRGFGPCSGGAVWLGPETKIVNVCEGLETGLGVLGILGNSETVAATLSTSGMVNWKPRPDTKLIRIWPDGDPDRIQASQAGERRLESPGLRAARTLAQRLRERGLRVGIQPTPQTGRDYLEHFLAMRRAAA